MLIGSHPQQTTLDFSDKYLLQDGLTGEAKYAELEDMQAKVLGPGGAGWTSWTPTFTNLSGGTLSHAQYKQIGKMVFFRFLYILAGAGVSGGVQFTLPVTATANSAGSLPTGEAWYNDNAVDTYYGLIRIDSTTLGGLLVHESSGTYLRAANLSSTIPFTWGNNDRIMAQGYYEAA